MEEASMIYIEMLTNLDGMASQVHNIAEDRCRAQILDINGIRDIRIIKDFREDNYEQRKDSSC
jgi:hypothetical protein